MSITLPDGTPFVQIDVAMTYAFDDVTKPFGDAHLSFVESVRFMIKSFDDVHSSFDDCVKFLFVRVTHLSHLVMRTHLMKV